MVFLTRIQGKLHLKIAFQKKKNIFYKIEIKKFIVFEQVYLTEKKVEIPLKKFNNMYI